MTGSAVPGGKSILTAAVLGTAVALLIAACGSNGSSEVGIPPPPPEIKGELTGVVYGPPAVVEPQSAKWWPSLISPAYANLYNEIPFGIRQAHVTLSSLTAADAADGRIDFYDPIVQTVPTDADGRYRVIHTFVETLESCTTINQNRFVGRLLVSVSIGDPNHQGDTRALVVSTQTDVDASTEAVVRLVLRRIFEQEPPVGLCDLSIEGLRNMVSEAQDAAYTAQGDTVGEINADAYRLASENCDVLEALDEATCREVDGEQVCFPVSPPFECERG